MKAKSIWPTKINVSGKPVEPGEEIEVEASNTEIKKLIQHKYLAKIE